MGQSEPSAGGYVRTGEENYSERRDTTGHDCDRIPDEQGGEVLEEIMKITYDRKVDVLRLVFSPAPIEESDEDRPGVILDYDKDGNIVGLEILKASTRVENPRSAEYAVAG